MDAWDIIITPMYLCFILIIAFIYVRRNRQNELIRKYFLSGLSIRFLGGILFGIIYQFYYKGGDTFTFWNEVKTMNNKILYDNPLAYLEMFFKDPFSSKFSNFSTHIYELQISNDVPSFFIVKTAAFISLFTFTTYSTTALFFSLISFAGSWKLFTTLSDQYPSLSSKFAFSCLFLPSITFWGGGIMKDSICLASICFMYGHFYELITYRKRIKKNIAYILISAYVLYIVKIYILICFIPGLIIWLFIKYHNNIKSKATRNFLRPIVIVFACSFGFIGASLISMSNERYNLQKLQTTSMVTATYIKQVSIETGGSVYDLGEIDYSFAGLLQLIPKGINVTLFRPYIWEVKNIVMLLAALESSYFIWITLSVIFKNGLTIFAKINNDTFVFSSIIFSLTFAFAVGISTYNFGSLVRYKLPMMPFYLSAMIILNQKSKTISLTAVKNKL